MKNLLNSVKTSAPGKSLFDLSHEVKMTGQMGRLYPCMYMETVPGDKITLKPEALIRFAPLISPVMHKFHLSIHYFFVPYRLLWDNWEDFIMGNSQPLIPFVEVSTYTQNDLASCLGLPYQFNDNTAPLACTAFPWAAYQFIYNEYYRDQNLIPEVNYKLVNGVNNSNSHLFVMRNRAWEHDYFTAALPWAQKGQPVNIPITITGDAPVFLNNATGTTLTGTPLSPSIAGQVSGTPFNFYADTDGNLINSSTINDLRRAYALQEWLEKNARGGTRYVEWILNHFGFKTSDARLQRPEYITGIKQPIIISEVLNTTGESGGLPQGNMAGHAVSYTDGNAGTFYSEEYGAVMGILSVMPQSGYAQAVPKYFLRQNNLDYYQPSFDHIGEQPLLNVEVYSDTPTNERFDVFGYLPRYCEYKYQNSRLATQMATTYNFWNLDRIFANKPSLNQTFIECTPQQCNRIFAVQDINEDNLFMHIRHNVNALRPMSKYSTPM